jgi:uncharacterized GH25 family protein
VRIFWSCLVAASAIAAPALAHDFWMQPKNFWPAADVGVPVSIVVGHGPDRQPWGAEFKRITLLTAYGRTGKVDHRPDLAAAKTGDPFVMSFHTPGTQVVAMQTSYAESSLPAIRYNDYAKVEGLTPALELREKTHATENDGREIYSRRAKALVQVGPPQTGMDPQVTKPIGLNLEIIPEKNPYLLAPNEALPVQVLYEGKPLVGATVKLTNLDFDGRPLATQISDATGHASFSFPRIGPWLINVIWTKPIKGNPKADFDTTFSSLTFAYPRTR